VTLVGASNELPESEELDALYDRFLLRKEVKQVTAGGECERQCGTQGRPSMVTHQHGHTHLHDPFVACIRTDAPDSVIFELRLRGLSCCVLTGDVVLLQKP
jgi:hypothetical protein